MGAEQRIVSALLPAGEALLGDTTSNLLGVVGGLGAGKTRILAQKGLQLAMANPGLPVLFGEATFNPGILRVAVPMFREVLIEWGLWRKTKYAKRDQELRIPFGKNKEGIVWFINLGDPDALAGPNAAAGVVDEAGLDDVKTSSASQVRSRIRHPRAKLRQFVCGGTPDQGRRGWFYRWFVDEPAKKPGVSVETRGRSTIYTYPQGDETVRVHLVRAPTSDNFFLPADFIETQLGHFDEVLRKRYVEGEFLDLYGKVYPQYNADRHNRPSPDPTAGHQVLMCDFGASVQAWSFGQILNPDSDEECAWVTEEFIGQHVDTIEHGRAARRRQAERLNVDEDTAARLTTVYCDPAGGELYKGSASDVAIFEALGFRVDHRKKHPPRKDRVNAVNRAFHDDRLFIDGEKCPYIERCISHQGYDRLGRPEKGRPREGLQGLDHGADAVGYFIEKEWPCTFGQARVYDLN